MVEDDGAVWPAVMIDKTQIGEEADSNCLKAPLVTDSETIAVNLEKKEKEGRGGGEVLHNVSQFSCFFFNLLIIFLQGLRKNNDLQV